MTRTLKHACLHCILLFCELGGKLHQLAYRLATLSSSVINSSTLLGGGDDHRIDFLHMCSFDGKNAKKNGPILKELERIAEPEVVDWLVEEMTANRQKQVVKDKVIISPGILLITLNSQDKLERHGFTIFRSQGDISCEEAGRRAGNFWISSSTQARLCFMHGQVYPYGKLHKAVPPGVILDGHDARGHADWIHAVEENPDILMPNNQ